MEVKYPDWQQTMVASIRVLLADDSASMRRAICALLDTEPTIVLAGEANSYSEVVEMVREAKADVIVMDVRMPGLRDADAFKDQLHGSCVLAISFWNDEETASVAKAFGAIQLLDKGSLVSSLIPAIKECVSQNGKGAQA